MPSPGCDSQIPAKVDALVHRLAELSDMFSKGELPVMPDTLERREWIARYSSSVNGNVGLQGRFCTFQDQEGCIARGCHMGHSRFSKQ